MLNKRIVLIDPFDSGHHRFYACTLASNLTNLGWEVYLIGSKTLVDSVSKECSLQGAAIVPLPSGRLSELNKFIFLRKAMSSARTFNASRIHLVTLDRFVPVLAFYLIFNKMHATLYGTLHWGHMLIEASGSNFSIKDFLVKLILLRITRKRISLMMHSNSLVSLLGQSRLRTTYVPFPFEERETEQCPSDVRVRFREREKIPEESVVVLCFGETRTEKGADIAIHAISMLPSNFILVIAGPEKDLSHIQLSELASSIGVRDRVVLKIGYIPDSDVSELFLGSDVLLLPYHKSFCGQSGPLITAASHRLSIVASNALVLRETVLQYHLGEVANDDGPNAFANAIVKSRIGRNTPGMYTAFREAHSPAHFANSVAQFYEVS